MLTCTCVFRSNNDFLYLFLLAKYYESICYCYTSLQHKLSGLGFIIIQILIGKMLHILQNKKKNLHLAILKNKTKKGIDKKKSDHIGCRKKKVHIYKVMG